LAGFEREQGTAFVESEFFPDKPGLVRGVGARHHAGAVGERRRTLCWMGHQQQEAASDS